MRKNGGNPDQERCAFCHCLHHVFVLRVRVDVRQRRRRRDPRLRHGIGEETRRRTFWPPAGPTTPRSITSSRSSSWLRPCHCVRRGGRAHEALGFPGLCGGDDWLHLPDQGAWNWGGGALTAAGYFDFAGSGTVHMCGAAAAWRAFLSLDRELGNTGRWQLSRYPGGQYASGNAGYLHPVVRLVRL